MAEMKWIKIATDMFSDQKIMRIEERNDADAVEMIWIKLLVLAGQRNNGGIFSVDGEPVSLKQFSLAFMRPIKKVKAAFEVLEQYGLIDTNDGVVTIPNWSKYQTCDKSEKITDYHREYMRDYRKRNREVNCEVNSEVTREGHKNKNIDIDIKKEIIEKESPSVNVNKHQHGTYKNVLLTDDEYQKLKDRFPDADERIDYFSERIKAKGYTYKSHYAAILSWAKKDEQDAKKNSDGMMKHGYDYDALFGSAG